MQQLLCQLAVSQRWVQNQVLLSAGQAPSTLFFLVTGQVRPWAGPCVDSSVDSISTKESVIHTSHTSCDATRHRDMVHTLDSWSHCNSKTCMVTRTFDTSEPRFVHALGGLQVAICVRSPPDSSQLVDVTRLGPGDTCGEAALLVSASHNIRNSGS